MSAKKFGSVLYTYVLMRADKKTLGSSIYIQRLETTEEVQEHILAIFQQLQSAWQDGCQCIDFTPSYTPKQEEIFSIPDFNISAEFQRAANHRHQFKEFKQDSAENKEAHIKAILAIHKDLDEETVTYYFQTLDRRHILDKKKWYPIFFFNNKYSSLDYHGISIGDHLTAVIDSSGTLLFRSFRDASQLISLEHIFKEATNEDITKILNSGIANTTPDDTAQILQLCDDVTRKRFSQVLHEGTLSHPEVSAEAIQTHAKKFGIEIKMVGKVPNRKIVFPNKREGLRQFLKFLCQDYYESLLTGDKCVSNSHRKIK